MSEHILSKLISLSAALCAFGMIHAALAATIGLSASTSTTACAGHPFVVPVSCSDGPSETESATVGPLTSTSSVANGIAISGAAGTIQSFATANVSYGSITLSDSFVLSVPPVWPESCFSALACLSGTAEATGGFTDTFTFFRILPIGPDTMNLTAFLQCPGGFACTGPQTTTTLVAPTQVTYGVPFTISASVTVPAFGTTDPDAPLAGDMGSTWILALNVPVAFEYTTASGVSYPDVQLGAFITTPEPPSELAVTVVLGGFLGLVLGKHTILRKI